jgi:hypothetical protein
MLMEKQKISFIVEVPDDITMSDLNEFLQFELQITGGMSTGNALSGGDLSQLNPTTLKIVKC